MIKKKICHKSKKLLQTKVKSLKAKYISKILSNVT